MNGIRIGRRDVSWTFGNLILSSGVNLLLLPLILWALTPEEVGLWYVYSAIGGLALVLDLGLSATLSRHVTAAWCGVTAIQRQGYEESALAGAPNYHLLRSLLSATRGAYMVVGLVALTLAGTAGSLQVQIAAGGQSLFGTDFLSWWIYLAAIWVNTSMAYWNPLLRGVGAVAESGQANVAGKLAQLVLTSAALVLGLGLTGVAASYLASTAVFRFMSMRSFHQRAQLHRHPAAGAKSASRGALLLTIWPNAARQGMVSLSQYLMSWSPVLVASSFLGLRTAASVGVTVQVVGIIKVFGNALFNAFLPQFTSHRLSGDAALLRARLSLALGTATYLILGVGTLVLLVGPSFLTALGTEVRLMTLGPGLCFLVSEWATNQASLASSYLSTANRVPMHRAFLATAVLGTAGQVIAVAYLEWGVWGIVVPPLVVAAVYNDWVWHRRAAADLGITPAHLLTRSLAEPYSFLSKHIGGR